MEYLFVNMCNNIEMLSPAAMRMLGRKGWCAALTPLWESACHQEEEGKYKTRITDWLGRDLSKSPVKINNTEYYSFIELVRLFNYLNKRQDLNQQEKDFVEKMQDTYAFIDAALVYQVPFKSPLATYLPTLNIEASFPYVQSVRSEKESKSRDNNIVFSEIIDLSISDPLSLSRLLNDIDTFTSYKIFDPKYPPTLRFSDDEHYVGVTKIKGEWKIFDQNKLTDQQFYVDCTPATISDKLFEEFNPDPSKVKSLEHLLANLTISVSPAASVDTAKLKTLLAERHKDLLATNYPPSYHSTFLNLAAQYNYPEKIRSLLKPNGKLAADPSVVRHALCIATEMGNTECAKILIQGGPPLNIPFFSPTQQHSPVHSAARSGKNEVLELLIQQGALVNEINPTTRNSALHLAAGMGQTNAVKTLLQHRLDPNLKNIEGMTPLHEAAKSGNIEVVKLLIGHKDDPNQADPILDALPKANAALTDNMLHTPLHMAAAYGHLGVVKLLYNDKIAQNRNNMGENLLDLAIKNKQYHIIEFLLEKNFPVNKGTNYDLVNPNVANLLKIAPENIKQQGPKQYTALHTAVELKANPTILGLLLHKEQATRQNTRIKLEPLINMQNDLGDTALHMAIEQGNIYTVQFLLGSGASVSISNKANQFALDLALQKGDPLIIKEIELAGGIKAPPQPAPVAVQAAPAQVSLLTPASSIGDIRSILNRHANSPEKSAKNLVRFGITEDMLLAFKFPEAVSHLLLNQGRLDKCFAPLSDDDKKKVLAALPNMSRPQVHKFLAGGTLQNILNPPAQPQANPASQTTPRPKP